MFEQTLVRQVIWDVTTLIRGGLQRVPVKMWLSASLSGEPDYFGRNKISSGGDLSHYSSASLY